MTANVPSFFRAEIVEKYFFLRGWYTEKMKLQTIRASQFILRPFRKGDEKFLVENLNNKKITKNLFVVPSPYTLKDAKEWIDKNLKEYKKEKQTMFNFVIDVDGEVIGSIGVRNIAEHHMAEIGYWLSESYWGKGIMTEAVKLITKFGFKELRLKRMYAFTYPSNTASQKTLLRNGYVLEGILKKHVYKNKKFLDDYLYANVK